MSVDPNVVDAAAELGRRGAEQNVITLNTGDDTLDKSIVLRLHRDDEVIEVVDLERHLETPRSARGRADLHDPDSFASYVERMHVEGTRTTTVWADDQTRRVVAVFNDHVDAGQGQWRDNRLVLTLRVDPDWAQWRQWSGTLRRQVEFGEFLQDQAHNILDPAAADMVDVALNLTGSRNVSFESSNRLQTGDVAFEYREETKTKTGKGKIEVPEKFSLRMPLFVGGDPVEVTARLRYRITEEELTIGYRLDQADLLEREAFDAILAHVQGGIPAEVTVLLGTAPEPLR